MATHLGFSAAVALASATALSSCNSSSDKSADSDVVIERYANGQKESEGRVVDGEREGKWTWWSEDGQKLIEGSYAAGKEHGHWTTWDAKGVKQTEGDYDHGKKQGLWKRWDDGKLTKVGEYRNGLEHGHWTVDFDTGRDEGDYVNGKKSGEWVRYYQGHRQVLETYRDGARNGRYVELTVEHGVEKPSVEGQYVDGEKDGIWLTWSYVDHPVKMEEKQFAAGQPTGTWSFRDVTGKLLRTESYESGKLVSVNGKAAPACAAPSEPHVVHEKSTCEKLALECRSESRVVSRYDWSCEGKLLPTE